MKKAVLWSLVLLLIGAAPAAAGWTNVVAYPDIPDAVHSHPGGISDEGKVSGRYWGEDNTYDGFLYDGPDLTTYDIPGYTTTWGSKISDYGIVGSTQDPNSGLFIGYVYEKGFTTFSVPGGANTMCEGINDHGQMVGNYWLSGSEEHHGFLYDGFGFETLDVLGATETRAYDINNHGQIVGTCIIPIDEQPGYKECGFLYDGTGYTILEMWPGDSNVRRTNPLGINDDGIVVGYFAYGWFPEHYHGFLFDGENYINLDFPNMDHTYIYDINNEGRLLGKWIDQSGEQTMFTAYHAPLPPALWLFGTGLVGLIGLRGWRRKNQGNS